MMHNMRIINITIFYVRTYIHTCMHTYIYTHAYIITRVLDMKA